MWDESQPKQLRPSENPNKGSPAVRITSPLALAKEMAHPRRQHIISNLSFSIILMRHHLDLFFGFLCFISGWPSNHVVRSSLTSMHLF